MRGGIGALRERIILERAVDEPSAGGQLARRYDGLATVWAGLKPLMGAQQQDGQTVGSAANAPSMKALIRLTPYVAGLGPQRLDTFLHWPRQGRRFRVAAAEEIRAEGRFLSLDLVEVGTAS